MITNTREVLFCLTHPLAAIEAKLRQIGVGIEAEGPPQGSTIESFPMLPISVAAALIRKAREKELVKNPPSIQLEDWSQKDQKLIKEGKRPQGTPLHRNL